MGALTSCTDQIALGDDSLGLCKVEAYCHYFGFGGRFWIWKFQKFKLSKFGEPPQVRVSLYGLRV